MKRRIDVSDLQQLTSEQWQKLKEWYVPQEGDIVVHDVGGKISVLDHEMILAVNAFLVPNGCKISSILTPLLDISQMIEIVGLDPLDEISSSAILKNTEFADELWEAVKKVL